MKTVGICKIHHFSGLEKPKHFYNKENFLIIVLHFLRFHEAVLDISEKLAYGAFFETFEHIFIVIETFFTICRLQCLVKMSKTSLASNPLPPLPMPLNCLKTLLFVSLCIKVSNDLETFLFRLSNHAMVVVWSYPPCSWSA